MAEELSTQTNPMLPPPEVNVHTAVAPARTSRRRLLDTGAIIAVLGLAFGVATYFVDAKGQDRADERAARSELTQIVESISALPRVYANFDTTEVNASIVGGSAYSAELNALVSQAERIVNDHKSVASSADYWTIGNSHLQLANFDRAIVILEESERRAVQEEDSIVAIAARRGLGIAFFGSGRLEDGRDAFERAVDVEGFDVPGAVQSGNAVITMYQWIGQEIATGNCDDAGRVLDDLKDLKPPRTSFDPASLTDLVAEATNLVASCV